MDGEQGPTGWEYRQAIHALVTLSEHNADSIATATRMEETTMNTRRLGVLVAVLGMAGASMAALQVRAGGDQVAFPENYAQGVMYYSFDRPDVKQYRETFVTPSAIDALKNGQPVPSGTVITTLLYKAQLDADGNPVKDANGRFIKADLVGYAVMEKRTGWGAEYPEEKRNGEWEYQLFTPERKVSDKANLNSCFECHKPHANTDFLFTADKIKAASK
jgi:hypothetical protein